MHVEEKEAKLAGTSTEPVSEPLTPLAHSESEPLSQEEADEIFLNAVSEIPTQPLPKLTTREEIQALLFLSILVLSFIVGSFIALITYPTVTIDLVPISKHVSLTTQLTLPVRTIAPVTLTKTATAPTTGKGHQDATRAGGTLSFYNGLFTQQTIPIGTIFTGKDGVEVTTDESVTIPAANPPQFAETTVTAHTLNSGAAGNIQAGDINITVSNGVLVKNTSAFHGGRDARDFQAVSQSDLDNLTTKLQQQLTQALPHQFLLRSGEALQTTNCLFKATPNHQPGAEAREVTVNASKTCEGIAYSQDELERSATPAFTTTRPGTNYLLEGDIQINVTSVSPFTVSLRGLWVYHLSQDYEQFLAQQIAGDTPEQARSYLLQTGFITQATVTQNLPKDPDHIHFLVLVGW